MKEKDDFLTREPEMIKAYRDTWKLGIHSYLTYMRDRLRVCRELLAESGSIFVQIGEENIHLIRSLLDDVFGLDNYISQISVFKTTTPRLLLDNNLFYLLWYAKNKSSVKYNQIYIDKPCDEWARETKGGSWGVTLDGLDRSLMPDEKANTNILPKGAEVYQLSGLTSSGASSTENPFEFNKQVYYPGSRNHWKTTIDGLYRLDKASRLEARSSKPWFKKYHKDFPKKRLTNVWSDTSGKATERYYVVQTDTSVIERCILMTTDPGDLVFDPTCGSGSTAYVAEFWGRRWITCDTSRVALGIARQRLLTQTYPYYKINDDGGGINPGFGFKYQTVPHITLKSIAQNTRLDPVVAHYNPLIEAALQTFNKAAGLKLKDWEVPFEPLESWPEAVQQVFKQFRRLKREKQQKIDAIIAEDAPQETLYDQPEADNKITRVSGPFTVEAIPPPVYEEDSPISGAPADMESFPPEPALNEGNHLPTLIDLLRTDGVIFPGNRRLKFSVLTPRSGGVLHAEGEAEGRKVAVSFGPMYGPVSILQVQDGLREANSGGYEEIIFCGFAFDPEAHATIRENPHPRVKAHASHIRPDILLTDAEGGSLLKTTASSQLFSVFGEPDVKLKEKKGEYSIHLRGVDVYDPIDGVVHSENAERVAAWFVDSDYDGQTFCIVQAFFPDKSAWKKIERALKGTLDEDRFDMLTGKVSLPFRPGKHRQAAVKVIDPRGNEVMKILKLG